MLHTGQRRKFVRITSGAAGGGAFAFPSFYLPLDDLGSGIVNTTPAIGTGPATFTHASANNYCKLASGLWAPVAPGIARAHYLGRDTAVGPYGGYLSETAGVQLTTPTAAIRDMTNAAWIKIGAPTVTLTGTGIDGVPNSCTRIVANAPNTTLLITLVAAASARTYSPFIRRVVGSGTILIQQGVTTLDVTASLNSVTLTRVELNASVLNVAYGVLIGSTGDSIDVDFNGMEALAATQFASSPMAATGAARAADVLTYPSAGNLNIAVGSAYAEFMSTGPFPNSANIVGTDVNGRLIARATDLIGQLFDGTNNLTFAYASCATAIRKQASSWGGVTQSMSADALVATSSAFDGAMGAGGVPIGIGTGGISTFTGVIRGVRIFPTKLTDPQLQALTAP
jgi:hypothetical protein